MYMRVFSIKANNSELSVAQHISQTSLRSNLKGTVNKSEMESKAEKTENYFHFKSSPSVNNVPSWFS